MVHQIETKIRKFHDDILLQSNFTYLRYLKRSPKKLCRSINDLDVSYSYYCIQTGVLRSNEIQGIIEKIKTFVC